MFRPSLRLPILSCICLFAIGAVLLAWTGGCGLLPAGPGSCGDPNWNPSNGEERAMVRQADGRTEPIHFIRLDTDGDICKSKTADAILAAIREKNPTDIYVLCPGWASGWSTATAWLESFLTGYETLRPTAEAENNRRPYRPLYIAVVWPTDVLVETFSPPSVSGGRRGVRADADPQALADLLSTDLSPARVDRIRRALKSQGHAVRAVRLDRLLSNAATLTPPEQVELADCLLPLFGPQEEPSAPGPRFAATAGAPKIGRIRESERVGVLEQSPAPMAAIDPLQLLETWKHAVRETAADVPHAAEKPGDDASRARRGGLRVIEVVRWAMKAADLRLMKDRAYLAGRGGISDLLEGIDTARGAAKVHLIGHSLGCEALLEALSCTPTTGPAATSPSPRQRADTLLLLQPLVSAWAFAPAPNVSPDVAPALQKFARAGGYRPAVSAVRGSIVVTRSARDWVLSYYAPKALRRPQIEGEASAETWAPENGAFNTIGGAGPAGSDPAIVPAPLITRSSTVPLDRSAWGDGANRLIVVDASGSILAHGEVNDPSIWRVLANQVESGK
jgi:hypothetical protein